MSSCSRTSACASSPWSTTCCTSAATSPTKSSSTKAKEGQGLSSSSAAASRSPCPSTWSRSSSNSAPAPSSATVALLDSSIRTAQAPRHRGLPNRRPLPQPSFLSLLDTPLRHRLAHLLPARESARLPPAPSPSLPLPPRGLITRQPKQKFPRQCIATSPPAPSSGLASSSSPACCWCFFRLCSGSSCRSMVAIVAYYVLFTTGHHRHPPRHDPAPAQVLLVTVMLTRGFGRSLGLVLTPKISSTMNNLPNTVADYTKTANDLVNSRASHALGPLSLPLSAKPSRQHLHLRSLRTANGPSTASTVAPAAPGRSRLTMSPRFKPKYSGDVLMESRALDSLHPAHPLHHLLLPPRRPALQALHRPGHSQRLLRENTLPLLPASRNNFAVTSRASWR